MPLFFQEDQKMRRYHFSITALLVTCFALIGMSLQASPPPKEESIDGTVLRAGNSSLTLMAASTSAIHKFAVASDAVITRDGSNAKLEEVRYGDFALVSVKKNENDPVATVIVALSPFRGQAEHR
jgi:hypothetical protein